MDPLGLLGDPGVFDVFFDIVGEPGAFGLFDTSVVLAIACCLPEL